ncbi:MAG: hypothetical protein U5J95_08650 [Balneolaceae bacterium]|nr:hypothetical protein [Balneolaceae bacterium]
MKLLGIKLYYFVILATLLLGCKNSSTGSSDSSDSQNPSLAIRLVNTGSGDFSISGDPDGYYIFCYEKDGCSDEVQGGFASWANEGQKSIFDQSITGKNTTGVEILFYVTEGTGKIEILRGTSSGENLFDDDYGFDIDKVVDTQGPFSKGDEIRFSFGDTQ